MVTAYIFINKGLVGDFLGIPVAKTLTSNAAVWVWSLVGQLRSHMPLDHKNQNIKQKQYCYKFNKDFKNGLHQKIIIDWLNNHGDIECNVI